MNRDEHRAEADRILTFIRDNVHEDSRRYRGTQAELDANIARAHVHALLALERESAHRFAIRTGLTSQQAQMLIERELADSS